MPTTPIPIKFDAALAFFRSKLPLPTERWDDITDEAALWAFTLAGVEKAFVLQTVRDAIAAILNRDTDAIDTYADFSAKFQDAMERGGYGSKTPWRTSLVFRQNIRTAYAAGRYQQMEEPEMRRSHPYRQWWHGHPIEPRLHHEALHQKVFKADDPFFNYVSVPSGFGCTCKILPLSERDLKREGLEVSEPPRDTVELRDRLTGRTVRVPAVETVSGLKPIVDPGFVRSPRDYSSSGRKVEILRESAKRLHPRLRSQVEELIDQWQA